MSSNEAPLFGLTDSEMRVALCALKVVIADGNSKVEKAHLARLTGHSNADTALRVWNMAKNKLSSGSPSKTATSLESIDTPTKGPKKTAAKMRTPNPKKRVKEQPEDEEAGDEEVEKRAKKRVKNEALKDTGEGEL